MAVKKTVTESVIQTCNIEQMKIGRTYVSDLLNKVFPRRKIRIFVTLDCPKMHLRAPEQLKLSLKNSTATSDIFDKSQMWC